jgi:hypothetical protein
MERQGERPPLPPRPATLVRRNTVSGPPSTPRATAALRTPHSAQHQSSQASELEDVSSLPQPAARGAPLSFFFWSCCLCWPIQPDPSMSDLASLHQPWLEKLFSCPLYIGGRPAVAPRTRTGSRAHASIIALSPAAAAQDPESGSTLESPSSSHTEATPSGGLLESLQRAALARQPASPTATAAANTGGSPGFPDGDGAPDTATAHVEEQHLHTSLGLPPPPPPIPAQPAPLVPPPPPPPGPFPLLSVFHAGPAHALEASTITFDQLSTVSGICR